MLVVCLLNGFGVFLAFLHIRKLYREIPETAQDECRALLIVMNRQLEVICRRIEALEREPYDGLVDFAPDFTQPTTPTPKGGDGA
jgi:hypothetical protein